MIGVLSWPVPTIWPQVPFRRIYSPLKRPVPEDAGIVTAYTDGQVTLRENRDKVGYHEASDLSSYQGVEPGDLVVHGLDILRGSVGVSDSSGAMSNVCTVCRPLSGADPRFVAYVIRAQAMSGFTKVLARGIREGGADFRRWDTLGELPIPVPPLVEQRRIADFLDNQVTRIDDAVEGRQAQLELFDDLERISIVNHVAGAWPGIATRPGPVPWIPALGPSASTRKLARILTLQRGVDLTEEERLPGEVPVITTAGAVGWHNIAVVRGPGVVIGRYGSAGNVHWIDDDFWPHNTTLYVKDYFGNRALWVYYLLRAFPFEMLQARSAIPGINRNDMAGDLMPWLPLEQQDECLGLLQPLLKGIGEGVRALEESIRLFKELKRSLIAAAVTGEFDVSAASGRGVPA